MSGRESVPSHCRSLLVLGLAIAISSTQAASANEHLVEYLLPRGAGQGETVQVQFYGIYLNDPAELVTYRPGITALSMTHRAVTREGAGLAHGGKVEDVVTVTLQIARDCTVGEHLLRLRTRTLLSEPMTFWVGPYPTVDENETKQGENDNAKSAQTVDVNTTINGQIQRADHMDRDCFAMDVKKGDRISADLESVRLGTQNHGGENDCQIRLFAPDGIVLAQCDDTALMVQDPFLSVIAPADGRYVIEVSQQMHTPGPRCYYRLHLGSFACPSSAFPLGGRPGEEISLQLMGDARGSTRAKVTLPNNELSTTYHTYFSYHPEDGEVVSPTPLPLRVTEHRNEFEAGNFEAGNLEADANTVRPDLVASSLPVAFNGTIGVDGEVDEWRFAATKDQRLDIRGFARSLGTPLDAKVSIVHANSTDSPLITQDDGSLAEHDFWSCHNRLRPKALLDPVLTWKAPSTGEYLLRVEDTRGIGGPEHHYRIEVDTHVDGLHPNVLGLYAFKIPRATAFVVPQGNRWTINVMLGESLGTNFRGDIELEATGLPKAVTMIAPRFTNGLRKMPVQFVAAADAKPGTSLIQLIAKTVDGSPLQGMSQQGFTYTDRRGGYAWHSVFVEEFALAVVEPAPFQIEFSAKSASLARSGEISLDLDVIRQPGFDDPLELQADWLPPGVEKGPPVVLPRGNTKASLALRATGNATAGTWPLTVTATTVDGDVQTGAGCRLVTTPVLPLEISDPYLSIEFHRTAIQRGKRGALLASIKHNRSFSGEATAGLLRLPFGVKLLEPLPRIKPDDDSCAFQLEVTPDALIGSYKEISAEITIMDDGQPIRQQSGNGVLRVDPARGEK